MLWKRVMMMWREGGQWSQVQVPLSKANIAGVDSSSPRGDV